MQPYQYTDGIEPRVVSEQIPAADGPIKTVPVPGPIVLPDALRDRARRQRSFDRCVQTDQPTLGHQVDVKKPPDLRRHPGRIVLRHATFPHNCDVGGSIIVIELGLHRGCETRQ